MEKKINIYTKEREKERQAIANEIVDIYKKHSLSLQEISYVNDEIKGILLFSLHVWYRFVLVNNHYPYCNSDYSTC